ncbi:choice-of-anchor D domain-containing protein [Bernardetia sp. ABR2-2B]|uniref:choice-of-anchor D domain-containing protein n=1 Tax=Bernardetia sp. ABR2-2B TaxID=3127472 RepID=UPI0030D31FD7
MSSTTTFTSLKQQKPTCFKEPLLKKVKKTYINWKHYFFVLLFMFFTPFGYSATFTVSSLADSGTGSLREAITLANANADADIIEFSVNGIINLATPLPSITRPLTIDGTSTPGYVFETNMIWIRTIGNAIQANSSGVTQLTIKGLDLSNPTTDYSGTGLYIRNASNVLIDELIIKKRGTAILVQNSTDVTITDSKIVDNTVGVRLENLYSGSIPNGISMSGNSIKGSLNNDLYIRNIDNLIISDGTIANTNISFSESLDGNNDFYSYNNYNYGDGSIYIIQCDNIEIRNIDVSSLTERGAGVNISNCQNVLIDNITAKNREAGVAAYNTTDITITNCDFRDNTPSYSYNESAIFLSTILSNTLQGGVLIEDNQFGIENRTTIGRLLYVANSNNIVVSDGTYIGTNIALPSLLEMDFPLSFDNVFALEIHNLTIKSPTLRGTGISIESGGTTQVDNITFENKNIGMYVESSLNTNITCSSFVRNGNAIEISDNSTDVSVENTTFVCNTLAIENAMINSIDAQNNYWGESDGSISASGSGDAYTGLVDATNPLASQNTCAPVVLVSEIEIEGNSLAIPDEDTTPIVGDNTDFGSILFTTGSIEKTFTINNNGDGILNISSISRSGTNAGEFAIGGITFPASVAVGGSATFTVTFDPISVGDRFATISIVSDDCDKSPYTFAVKGKGDPLTTTVTNLDDSGVGSLRQAITNSQINPGADVIDFTVQGIINLTSSLPTINQPLTIDGTTAPSYAVGSPTVTVSINNRIFYVSSVNGFSLLGLNITSNGSVVNEGLYIVNSQNVTIEGNIFQNKTFGLRILNAGVGYSIACNTFKANQYGIYLQSTSSDFASFINNSFYCNTTYAIYNTSGVTIDAENNYWGNSTGSSTDGGVGDAYSGNITATNPLATANACSPTVPLSVINTQGNSITISNGDTTPATTDDTDFGNTLFVGGTVTKTYTIQNTGNAPLVISNIYSSGANSSEFTRGGISLPATIAAAGSTTFTMRFDPLTVGTRTATVNIASNDCDKSPYTFSVKGIGDPLSTVVTNLNNSGAGSLRQAMLNSETNPGADVITFTVQGTISQSFSLPTLTQPTEIDGTSAPGYATGVPSITIARTSTVFTISNASNVELKALDISNPSSNFLGNAIQITNSSRITIDEVIAKKRIRSVSATSVTDLTITNSDFRDSGSSDTNGAITINGLSQSLLSGGILMNDNQFGAENLTPVQVLNIQSANYLRISDGTVGGTNITMDNSGLDMASPFKFDLVNYSRIDKLDFTNSTSSFNGIAINSTNCRDLRINDIIAKKRRIAIKGSDNIDIRITNSDLRDSGSNPSEGAITMNSPFSSSLNGGVYFVDNQFGAEALNPTHTLVMTEASNLIISNSTSGSTNITIDTGGGRVLYPITLNDVDNSTIRNVDLSRGAAGFEGYGIWAYNNCQGLTITNTTIKRRLSALVVEGATDVRVTNNDFRDSGSNRAALVLWDITSSILPGGMLVAANQFGAENQNPARTIHLQRVRDIVISDGTTTGTNINLASGLDVEYPVLLSDVDNVAISELDFSSSVANAGNGIAIYISDVASNSSQNVSVDKVTIANKFYGVYVERSVDISLTCNLFTGNNIGLQVVGNVLIPSTFTTISNNNFGCNTVAINNTTTSNLNAQNNYWGAADGSVTDAGSGDSYLGNVDVSNFLTTASACAKALPVTEINVKGNTLTILDGDITPRTDDGTDFEGIQVTSGVISKTFTIENTGSSPLTVTSISTTGTHASDFTISGVTIPTSVASNSSTTFVVDFDPSALGIRTATVVINNNDCSEGVYDFAIQGEGSLPASITLEAINPTSYCSGTTISVPFNTTGSFGGANTFTAELSDASGNFPAIATATGTSPIALTIPNSATSSSNYVVRVVASNPAIQSANSSAITITQDITNPVITAPAPISVVADAGLCTAVISNLGTPTATDNCNAPTVTNNALANFPLGATTVTWTATDASGNTATATQIVTVIDNQAPLVPALSNVTSECSVTLTAPTTTDNCAGTITGTTTTTFPITTQGTTVVNWNFNDGNGNSSSVSQVVTIADLTPPATPVLADINSECSITPTAPTTTDNCAGTITGTTTTVFPITAQGTTVVTWRFVDANGNSVTADQNVVINDVTPPAVPTLADVNSSCSITPTAPTTTDNCAGTITGTTTTVFPITAQGTTVVTWTFTDANGNSVTADQNVVIDDVTPPVTPVLADVNASCSTIPATPTTTDNCGALVTGTTTTIFPITATTVITWTFTDVSGNSTTADQNVIINDAIAPVVPVLPDFVAECSANPTIPTTTDNCAGTVIGTTTTVFPITTQGAVVVTWTFDDGNGNSVTANQNVIVNDMTPPVVPFLSTLSDACSITPTAPTTTDNCGGTITGTTTTVFPITTQGVTIVTWTFTDTNGNSITANQSVVINDIIPPAVPTLADVTAQCSVTPTAPTTTDNCGATITGTTTTVFPITTQGTTIVTWTFTDANGNTSTADQNVIVDDVTPPAIPFLAILSDACSITPTAPTTTDNCGGTITGTTTTVFPITTQGTTVIDWTFDDGNGNVTIASQNVLIIDITAPVAPVLATLTDVCSVTPTAPTTTDNCSGTITGTTTTVFPITAQGTTTVTWTFDDGNGNTSTANQTIIISDDVEPVLASCPSTLTVSAASGFCEAIATYTIPTATDNCSLVTVTQTAGLPSGSSFPIGATTNTFVAIDAAGNTSTCSFDVVVNSSISAISYSSSAFVEPSPYSSGQLVNTLTISSDDCDVFAGSNGEDFVATGKVTVTNLPAGLTASIIRNSATVLSFNLTGSATAHEYVNSVSDLTVVFEDAAFTNNSATGITGSTRTDLRINFSDTSDGTGGTPTTPSLIAVRDFVATSVSTTQIQLTWTIPTASNATGYDLYRNGELLAELNSSTITSYLDESLVPNTFYSYRIISTRGVEFSDAKQASAYTYPVAPTLVSVNTICGDGVPIIKVDGQGSLFKIYDDLTSGSPIEQATSSSITLPSISQTTTYYISTVSNDLESERVEAQVVVAPTFEAQTIQTGRVISCENSFVLSAQPIQNADSYVWLLGQTEVGTGQTFTVTRSGTYKVRITRGVCQNVSNTVSVTLGFTPTAQIMQGETINICQTGTLNAKSVNANSTYEWFLENQSVGTGISLEVSNAGTYELRVTENGCVASAQIAVTLVTLPQSPIVTTDKTALCTDEKATLSITESENVTYQWLRNGRAITNATSSSYSTSNYGNYSVEIKAESVNGCSVRSEEVTITRIQTPTPRLYKNTEYPELYVDTEGEIVGIVWTLDGTVLEEFADQSTITPNQDGNYVAAVTYSVGCRATTSNVYFRVPDDGIVTGTEDLDNDMFNIYPNPSNTGIFRIHFGTALRENIDVVVFDAIGRVIEKTTFEKGSKDHSLNLSNYAKGVYTIRLQSDGASFARKLIID